jgi:pyruvate dehydrogenase E1 component alpha subunit
MGINFEGLVGTGDPEKDLAVITYFGDGSTAEGDVSESLLFAAINNTPQVFFCQNNQWAISSPVGTQTKVPLFKRGEGFGVPGIRVDGNDVLACYAVTKKHMDDARSGRGPSLIEALTYRIGSHTTSDDPSKYRDPAEVAEWAAKDPIIRFERFLRKQGIGQDFFDEVKIAGDELAADLREKTFAMTEPPMELMFDHVYSEPHPLIDEQKAWLQAYEESLGGHASINNGEETPKYGGTH